METRNEEKGQIASTYTDTVAKLVEVSLVLQQVDIIIKQSTQQPAFDLHIKVLSIITDNERN